MPITRGVRHATHHRRSTRNRHSTGTGPGHHPATTWVAASWPGPCSSPPGPGRPSPVRGSIRRGTLRVCWRSATSARIEIANFVITGGLLVACAVGLRRVRIRAGPGTWGPIAGRRLRGRLDHRRDLHRRPRCRLSRGRSAGAPQLSWHGALHEVGHLRGARELDRRLLRAPASVRGRWDRFLSRACVMSVVAVFVIAAWPNLRPVSASGSWSPWRQFGLVALIAVRLRGTFGARLRDRRR